MTALRNFFTRVRYVLEKEKRKRYPRVNDTIPLTNKGNTRMIAHRGVSGIETENTLAAFHAAGTRTYFGIETDVHRTLDGKFVVFHDDTLKRMAGKDLTVEQTAFETLRKVPLFETRFYKSDSSRFHNGNIPTLAEYIAVCKQYDKAAVLELKNHFEKADIAAIMAEIAAQDWLSRTIFISFDFENLVFVREICADATVQFLTGEVDDFDALFDKLEQHRFDWDAYHLSVTPKRVEECHKRGIKVNVWTVDEPNRAKRLIKMGVDFITSDILE